MFLVKMENFCSNLRLLREYCESEKLKGWDPYDGLNSRVIQSVLPLKYSAFLRLCVIQGFKRCPVNLRRLLRVPKEYNAKGVGLFLQGYCNLYKAVHMRPELEALFGNSESLLCNIHRTAKLLLSLRSNGPYNGACWGYNFDWQARRLFLFPKNTPTVVATSFCASALFEAYEITHEKKYLEVALSSAEFVMRDLHRTPCGTGFLFAYSPLLGNNTVYNASLLGSRLLSYAYHYTQKDDYWDAARMSVQACVESQQKDGSWVYGRLPVQNWIDSFHTGYNIEALYTYREKTGDSSFDLQIEKGFRFYIDHFFLPDGCPKYYHNRVYPIDIHCPAQLFVTLERLGRWHQYRDLADHVMRWTLKHMQHKTGYFYYQKKAYWSSKIPYMRWNNAFMFYALTYALLGDIRE